MVSAVRKSNMLIFFSFLFLNRELVELSTFRWIQHLPQAYQIKRIPLFSASLLIHFVFEISLM